MAADAASEASGSVTRATTSEPHTAARSPPRRRRRRGVVRASQTGEGDSTARSPSSRRRSCELFYIVGQRSKSGRSLEKQDEVIVLHLNPHACLHVSSVGLSVLICNFRCCFCYSVTVSDLNGSGFSKVIATYGCGFFRSTQGPENPIVCN
jgi:hypothetical protein